jgi:hypothetical protein
MPSPYTAPLFTPDFRFQNSGTSAPYPRLQVFPLTTYIPQGVEVGTKSSSFALALAQGAKIGPSQNFRSYMGSSYGVQMVVVTERGPVGSWVNVKERYLGLKFSFDGQTHYFGWARLSVQVKGRTINARLDGYAWQNTPNQPIYAGQTGGSLDQPVFDPNAPTTNPPRQRHKISVNRPAQGPQLGSLGLLALGAPGLPFWRREKEPKNQ